MERARSVLGNKEWPGKYHSRKRFVAYTVFRVLLFSLHLNAGRSRVGGDFVYIFFYERRNHGIRFWHFSSMTFLYFLFEHLFV